LEAGPGRAQPNGKARLVNRHAKTIGKANYRRFYTNPKVIKRILTIPNNAREYANLFKASCGFMLNMIKKSG